MSSIGSDPSASPEMFAQVKFALDQASSAMSALKEELFYGKRLASSCAAILDAHRIPHILWGFLMLTVFGIPTIVDVSAGTCRTYEKTNG